jgi:putative toxin-antitoxin system antitoxin component (TIGR02293 family)
MASAATIYETLGGARALPAHPSRLSELAQSVRNGLPISSLDAVTERFGFGRDQVAAVLHLPRRTLARRRKQQHLTPEESDRLFRLARVAAQAVDVLGSREKAGRWLRHPNRALGGETPLSLVDTDAGARQVEEILGRIEHGVYS